MKKILLKIKNLNLKSIVLLLNKRLTQKILLIIISALATAILLIPFYSFFNNLSYDLMMKYIKKPIKQDDSLLLIDIDDTAMNFVPYRWVWPRYIHGDAVEVLADFGAKAAVYDFEFIGESAPGVNMNEIDNIKQKIQNNFSSIYDDYVKSTSNLANDPSAKSRLQATQDNFNSRISEYYMSINSNIDKVVKDNDDYFAKRLRYFGKAYGTVNMLYDINLTQKEIDKKKEEANIQRLKKFGIDNKSLLKNKKNHPAIKKTNIAEFSEDKIFTSYKNVGFTKVERDKDAAIRSINLFMENNGYVIPQLALTPFLDINNITVDNINLSSNNYVIIKNVKINNKIKTIKIPVYDGNMLINWPSGDFSEIFVNKKSKIEGKYYHFSYLGLLRYKSMIENLNEEIRNVLGNIDEKEAKNIYNDYNVFFDAKNKLVEDSVLNEELRIDMNKAFEDLLNRIINYCGDENLKRMTKEFDDQINKSTNKKLKEDLINGKNNFITLITQLHDDALSIQYNRKQLEEILKDKICFIGLTATGTTDLGSNPFDKKFTNVGTHPSVYNTILQNDFIYLMPVWLIILFSILLVSSGIWILIKKEAFTISITGALSLVMFLIFIFLIYRFTNLYISPIIPIFSIAVSFISLTILKYILTEKDKSFIKDAFKRYLSPDVINELLKDPSKLVLGGERRTCTAIFTDIEGFSSISEKFMNDPPGLVSLLNKYLSAMSDIILENKGTIDKYEGDAIISFFGAPHFFEDHSLKACSSAIKMKQIEEELNNKFLKEGIIDKPLKTRIGINTGDMFVGNMGTSKKFDYTMMGHNVNLASRIEGVNKLYGTYVMISEYTYEHVKDQIVCRKLDKVRVVNIKTPLRLYELICLKNELNEELKEKLETFDQALIEFENQNWEIAIKLFKKSKYNEQWDKAIELYLDRCKKFIKTPPLSNWDGVYNMSVK